MPTYIFEPTGGGHRFEYVAQVAKALTKLGDSIVILTSYAAIRRSGFEQHIAPMTSYVKVSILSGRSCFIAIRALARSKGHDLIDLDADARMPVFFLAACLGLGPKRVTALMMRPPWKARATATSRVKAMVWRVAGVNSRIQTMVLADCFGDLALAPKRNSAILIADKPKLHYSSTPQRSRVTRTSAGFTLLMGGTIDNRKAAFEVVAAARSIEGVVVEMVGAVDQAVIVAIANLPEPDRSRFLVTNRYVADEELDRAVAEADAVLVLLKTETGSSGLFGRSVAYGKPVIAGGNETIVNAVRTRGLGPVAANLSPYSIQVAINDLLHNYNSYRIRADEARREVSRQPSLGDAIAKLVRER